MKKSDLLQHIADLYRSIEALDDRVKALEGRGPATLHEGGDPPPPPPSGGGTGEE